MRKKVLSVLVSLCMVVNLLPSIAFAVSDETGIGKNSDTKNAMEIVNQAENGGDIIEDTPFDKDSDNLIDYVSEPIPVTVEDEVVVRTFDISNGDIKIEDSTTEGEIKVTYNDGLNNVTEDNVDPSEMLTIIGSTEANKIVVDTCGDKTINITLDNVSINISGVSNCAFDIQNKSVVNLILKEGTTNTLESGGSFAGLQVREKDGNQATVTIIGTGKLSATCISGSRHWRWRR